MPKMADGRTAIETPLLFLQVCVFTMNLSLILTQIAIGCIINTQIPYL